MRRSYKDFKNIHKGEKVIVLGCGKSASLVKEMEPCLTIGVNDISRLVETDYLVVVNGRRDFTASRWPFVQNSVCKTIFSQLNIKKIPIRNRQNLVPIKLGKKSGTSLFTDSVDFSTTSPYMAVIIAAYLGFTEIGMLGVDFTNDHFFSKTGKHTLMKRFNDIDQEFTALHLALVKNGVDFFNLSPTSILSMPKKDHLLF